MCLIRNDLEPEKHAFENKNEGCYRNSKTPQHHNWPKVLHCIWARILLARIPESFVLFDVSQRVQVSLELRFKKPKEGRRKGPPVMAVEVHEGNIRQIFKASQLIGRDCHIRWRNWPYKVLLPEENPCLVPDILKAIGVSYLGENKISEPSGRVYFLLCKNFVLSLSCTWNDTHTFPTAYYLDGICVVGLLYT